MRFFGTMPVAHLLRLLTFQQQLETVYEKPVGAELLEDVMEAKVNALRIWKDNLVHALSLIGNLNKLTTCGVSHLL